jgi:hypothetical protein
MGFNLSRDRPDVSYFIFLLVRTRSKCSMDRLTAEEESAIIMAARCSFRAMQRNNVCQTE